MSQTVQVELKNIRTMAGDETPAFSATLYVDRKRVGYVRSEGRGGPPFVEFIDPRSHETAIVEGKFRAWCLAAAACVEGKPIEELDDLTRRMAEEIAVFDLFEQYEETRALKRLCKKKTLFRVGDEPPHEWRTIAHVFSPDVKAFIVEKYGEGVEIANERF